MTSPAPTGTETFYVTCELVITTTDVDRALQLAWYIIDDLPTRDFGDDVVSVTGSISEVNS